MARTEWRLGWEWSLMTWSRIHCRSFWIKVSASYLSKVALFNHLLSIIFVFVLLHSVVTFFNYVIHLFIYTYKFHSILFLYLF